MRTLVAGSQSGATWDHHFTERRPDRCEQSRDVALEEMSDVTDAEAIGARHLAGVDHASPVVQPSVELLKLTVGMVWLSVIAAGRIDTVLHLRIINSEPSRSNAVEYRATAPGKTLSDPAVVCRRR